MTTREDLLSKLAVLVRKYDKTDTYIKVMQETATISEIESEITRLSENVYKKPVNIEKPTRIYYLGIRFTLRTDKKLFNFIQQDSLKRFRRPRFGFHTTIMYSSTPFDIPRSILLDIPDIKELIGLTTKTQLLDRSLVRFYESNFCENLHKTILDNGGTWRSFTDFKPFVTVAEDVTNFDLNDIEETTIPLYVREIFYRRVISNISSSQAAW